MGNGNKSSSLLMLSRERSCSKPTTHSYKPCELASSFCCKAFFQWNHTVLMEHLLNVRCWAIAMNLDLQGSCALGAQHTQGNCCGLGKCPQRPPACGAGKWLVLSEAGPGDRSSGHQDCALAGADRTPPGSVLSFLSLTFFYDVLPSHRPKVVRPVGLKPPKLGN